MKKMNLPVFSGMLGVFLLWGVAVSQVDAATLSLSPAAGSYDAGKSFTATVVVDGGTDKVNVAEASLSFDPSLITVSSVSKSGSAFTLWTAEPDFSNDKGTITFGGGSPAPFTGKKNILSITFKAIKEGAAKVSFDTGTVLAADGKGTDVLSSKDPATFTIGAAAVSAPAPTPAAADSTPTSDSSSGSAPDAPEIKSVTNPDQQKWYKDKTVKLTWTLPDDIDLIRLLLDTSSTTKLTKNSPLAPEKELKDVSDGINFFHLAMHNASGWGPAGLWKVMIDSTPPPTFTVEAKNDPASSDIILVFNATDTLSGLDKYNITVDTGTPAEVKPDKVPKDGYILSGQPPGEHKVSVIAFDKAGNQTEATASFTATGTPAVAGTADDAAKPAAAGTPWMLIFFIALSVFLVAWIFQEKKRNLGEREYLKREADEVSEKMGKIFSALRDEIEDQIHIVSQKPVLNDVERQVLESLSEALEMSEEVIGKELEDVRKLLR